LELVAKSSPDTDRNNVKPTALIAAVAVLILLVGALAWHFFGPSPSSGQARALTAEEKANQDWLDQKAKESGGDFNKLSPEDQRRLFSLRGPQGPFILKQQAARSAVKPSP
jgi:hypothetical protein